MKPGEEETITMKHLDHFKVILGTKTYRLSNIEGKLHLMLVDTNGSLMVPILVEPHASNVIIIQ
jgi:YbbR domain-containing protein